MQVNIKTIETTTNIQQCMSMCELQQESSWDNHLQQLKEQIIKGWPENKDHMAQNFRLYQMFQDDVAVIDQVILKGMYVVIPDTLQKQALDQFHINETPCMWINILVRN